ncbi:hypothetical protein M427DRAFT_49723 [Gonapodya prolifera JEL478]|uniref:LRAT domain-containing protein n=1 Tax=Gonapodya prolifera (strain JEL478) TaxID=1344416 RepID=A0A138ZYS1_GONPJ|nr:hypothetical protein M427DRAFT_49723 [Gonapodya prolifera JEL478]|eukprot:KXS09273.1 hypothetical protein M427DRAFT_49723 [Gonapodya prolifera JEL478]
MKCSTWDIIVYYIGGVSSPSAGQESKTVGQLSRHFAVYCGNVCNTCRALLRPFCRDDGAFNVICATLDKCARPRCEGTVLQHQIEERVDPFPNGGSPDQKETPAQAPVADDGDGAPDVKEGRARRALALKRFKSSVDRLDWRDRVETCTARCYSEKELDDFKKWQEKFLHDTFKEKYGDISKGESLWKGTETAKRAHLEERTPKWMSEYHIVINNCQHFTNWCKFGTRMPDDVYKILKMLPSCGRSDPEAIEDEYKSKYGTTDLQVHHDV